MADTFLGPINPGKPLIMNTGGGIPSTSRGSRSGSTKQSKPDDIDALFGQTMGYKTMESEFSMQKSMIKLSLFNMLKHKHQGNYANFMNDPEVKSMITAIHKMDAMSYANRNAIEQEKQNYIKSVETARANEAFDNYATDSRGYRFYIDSKTGQLKKASSREVLKDGEDFLKVGELYDYQRQNLGFNSNGVAQQGEWVTTIDNKQGYFRKNLKSWLKEASAHKDETTSLIHDKNHPDGLYATTSPSFLLSNTVYSSSNYKQVMAAANSIKSSLSKEALKDARQEFWDAQIDRAVMLEIEHKDKKGHVVNTEIAYVSPEDYERYKKGIINDPSEEVFLNAKRVTGKKSSDGKINKTNEENAKFNIWLVQQAREIMAPYLQKSVKYSPSYHKLTEAQVGAYYEGKKQSTLAATTAPEFIQKNGGAHRETLYQKVSEDNDGRGIYKKMDVLGSRMNLQGNSQKFMNDFNANLANRIYDSEGELKKDALEEMSVKQVLGDTPIIINGVIINDPKILKGLKIIRMNNVTYSMNNIKQTASVDGKNNLTPSGNYVWEDNGHQQGYLSYQVVADSDVIGELENYLVGQAKPLDSSYRSLIPEGDDVMDYTLAGTELNNAWFGVDPTNVADDKGFTERSVDGLLSSDNLSFEIKVPANASIGLDKSTSNATKHNLEFYNAANRTNAANYNNVIRNAYGN